MTDIGSLDDLKGLTVETEFGREVWWNVKIVSGRFSSRLQKGKTMVISVGPTCIKLFDQSEEGDALIFPFETLKSYKFNVKKRKGAFQMLDVNTSSSEWVIFKTDAIKPIEFEIKIRIQNLMNEKFGRQEIDWEKHTSRAKKAAKKSDKEVQATAAIKDTPVPENPSVVKIKQKKEKRLSISGRKSVSQSSESLPVHESPKVKPQKQQQSLQQQQPVQQQQPQSRQPLQEVSESLSSDFESEDDLFFNPFQQMNFNLSLNTTPNPFATLTFTSLNTQPQTGAQNPFATNIQTTPFSTTTYGGGGFQSSPQLVSPNSNVTGSNPFATTTANPFQGTSSNPRASIIQPSSSPITTANSTASNPFVQLQSSSPTTGSNPFATLNNTSNPRMSFVVTNNTPTLHQSPNPFQQQQPQSSPNANPFATTNNTFPQQQSSNPFATTTNFSG